MRPWRPFSLDRLKKALNQSLVSLSADRVVFHGHLGLGDQISAALALEAWSTRVPHVIVPAKPRNAPTLKEMLAYLPNVEVVPLETDDPRFEVQEVLRVAGGYKAEVVQASHEVFGWASRAYPEFGINRQLLVAALVQRDSAASQRFREHVLSLTPFELAVSEPYAFVDHHPETEREIPREFMARIESMGNVVLNPRGVPLHELVHLIDRAKELHMVSSAPLCLALTANLGESCRFMYRVGQAGLLKADYPPDWTEVALTVSRTRNVDRALESIKTFSLSRNSRRARDLFSAAIAKAQL